MMPVFKGMAVIFFFFNLKMENFPGMSEKAFLFNDGHFKNRIFYQGLLFVLTCE